MTQVAAFRQAVLKDIAAAVDSADSMLYTCPEIDRPPQRYRDRDGKVRSAGGGEWDWYWHLGNRERMRLVCRRCVPGGCAPDEIHFFWGAGLGYDDVESTMWAWLQFTRLSDAGTVLLHGRLPRPTAYGGLDANDLFPDTGHDLNQLFSGQASQYLETWMDPEELARTG